MTQRKSLRGFAPLLAAFGIAVSGQTMAASGAWEPTKPVEFVIPAAAPTRWRACSRASWSSTT